MKLEDQVCSLELSKKLAELGVAQESLYHWCTDLNEVTLSSDCRPFCKATCGEHLSAFTVAELGEMLPDKIWTEKQSGFWKVFLDTELPSSVNDTEADARAKMLIYLIENHLIQTP